MISATHFNVATGKTSSIDSSICSNEFTTFLEWRTLDYLHSSDHYPIITSINNTDAPSDKHTVRWKFYKAD